jgi:phage baseplate assembly protein W
LYEVIGRTGFINWGATGVEEVLQNVRMILTTPTYSVPLRRSWFIDYGLLDNPMPVAHAKLRADILRAIRQHEPRASVTEITFEQTELGAMDGRVVPRVVLEVDLDVTA